MPAPSKLDRTVDQPTYLSVRVVSHNYNNNNNDRLTAFDPGQPG